MHHSILTQKQFEIIPGTNENTLFLHLKPNSGRHTLIQLVYGKSNPTPDVSNKQWKSYSKDIKKIKSKLQKNTVIDIIFILWPVAANSPNVNTIGTMIVAMAIITNLRFLQKRVRMTTSIK